MDFRRRTLPTLYGAFGATWIWVTGAVLLGHWDPLLGGPFSNWVISMFVGSLGAGVLVVCCLAADAMIHGVRKPPENARALWSAVAALAGTYLSWHLWRPGDHSGLLWLLAAVLPMAAAALLFRFLFGSEQ